MSRTRDISKLFTSSASSVYLTTLSASTIYATQASLDTIDAATNYASGGFYTGGDASSGNTDSSNGDTAFQILPLESAPSFPGGVFNYTLFNPFETTYTRLTGFYQRTSGSGAYGYFRGGNLEVTTSYDGINIITDSAQNIAGVISIYGFNQ